MKIIRASDIGTYLFCNRAWWYHQQGYETENNAELSAGTEIHEKHSRAMQSASCLQAMAYAFLLFAILVSVVWIIRSILWAATL
jgi:CRISPR/Cas system-associated exonuclease Cas4 (RecB family)